MFGELDPPPPLHPGEHVIKPSPHQPISNKYMSHKLKLIPRSNELTSNKVTSHKVILAELVTPSLARNSARLSTSVLISYLQSPSVGLLIVLLITVSETSLLFVFQCKISKEITLLIHILWLVQTRLKSAIGLFCSETHII